MPIGKDYYKPIITKGLFNKIYIQYESRGYKDKILTVDEYLDIIRPYLVDIINDHKTQSKWKIRLTAVINFISSKPNSNKIHIIRSRSDNIEIMMGSETNEIIEELFKSLRQKYKKDLEESMEGSEFIFDSFDSLYYDVNAVSLSRGRSYIDSPEWLKIKKATVNPKNNDDRCFQYALTIELNHEQIKKDPQRRSKIKSFIDQYSWEEINFPTSSKIWKKFESNNESIAHNILYVPHNTKETTYAYKSECNLKREN